MSMSEIPTKKTKIAIISLYALENNGVRHVSSSLRRAGFPVTEVYFKDWVNNNFPWPDEIEVQNFINLLKEREIDFIGFSVRASAFHRMAKYLTERIRAESDVPILWGGMHPTFMPDLCIEVADYIAIGEVDDAVIEFFNRVEDGGDLHTSPSFWAREDTAEGTVIHKNDLAPLVNLDDIPFRDFHTQADKFHVEGTKVKQGDPFITNPEYTVLASRGCPYWTCTFCSNTVTKPLYEDLGNKFRLRSVENLIQEMEYATKLCTNIKVVRFDDEVFPIRKAWIEEFAEKWPTRVGIPFEVLVDPRMVTESSLSLLKQAGLRAICMGIQAHERVNFEFYNRPIPNSKILECQQIFRKVGIQANLQIIWDDPFSTEEDKDALFHMLMELERPFELYLFGLTIYPRTHLARRLLREGKITEQDIEGVNTHAFEQFRVDLNHPRPKADQRWLALIVLLNKNVLPKELIWKLYHSEFVKEHPEVLIQVAQMVNLAKMTRVAWEMLLRGEMTPLLIKRWVNPRSLVTM